MRVRITIKEKCQVRTTCVARGPPEGTITDMPILYDNIDKLYNRFFQFGFSFPRMHFVSCRREYHGNCYILFNE